MTTAEPPSAQDNDSNARCCDKASEQSPNKEAKTGSKFAIATDREQEMVDSFVLGYN